MAILKNLQQENEELKRQLAEAQRANHRAVSFKVAAKGGLSMYGLGRFPVTLYKEQWEVLLANADAIKAALKANAGSLSTKE